jgi:putative peptidoglycan lipid II flippase
MALFLLVGQYFGPDFPKAGLWTRIVWLLGLVGGGAATYFGAMYALGFRLRDFREH